jgi:hypothetical protein
MTPKEKLEELMNKMFDLFVKSDIDNLNAEQAKRLTEQFALITINEILNELSVLHDDYDYWITVKQELNKLPKRQI